MTVHGLKLTFLGPPQVELAGRPVAINRRKALAILAYLAVTGQPQRRDTLALLLWPESTPDAARKALRRDLSELNLALGGRWLDAEREQICLHPGFQLDVIQFQQHLDACAADPALCSQELEQAVTLYRGDFLNGFTLTDSPAFDEWQFFQTEALRQACASALERLVLALEDARRDEQAIAYARHWAALDPLHEPAHRKLMQLYAQTGQQAAALRQYERCSATLSKELDVPPSAETMLLFNQIRERTGEPAAAAAPPRMVTHVALGQLPTQTTPFIGRQQEVTEIGRLLLGEPACRLLNIFGPGGIGKTRLALAAVTAIRAEYPDGAFFVALASIGEAVFIVPAIAEALQFTFFGATDPTEQLIAHLRDKKLLLLLDNFEHLLDGASLLATILHQAPEITVLTTSRTRLHLQEEWVYTVDGLPFPAVHDPSGALVQPEADLNSYAAIQLFLQRARQTKPGFVPAAEEMAAIGRICQLVAGVPLGVELAAPWIRTLSCREIAAEIELSLDFLTSPVRNLPERHRSLRVVLEQTWQLLPTAGQAVLQHLSVFRGGSTREAAEQVAGATLPILTLLVDKALLRRTNTGRYELHELIRQFAEQQAEAGQTLKRAQHAHCEYFVAFLEARTARVKGSGQKDAIAEIKADIDNVRLVWRQAINNQDARIIERCAECLFVFYLYSSGHYEGETAFQQAAAAFTVGPGLTAELAAVDKQENLAAFLLAGQGYFLGRTRNPFGGQTCVEQALELLRRAKIVDRHVEGFARLWLGWMYLLQGNTDTSAANVEPTLALLIETGDCWGEGWCRLLWANMLSIVYPLEAEPIYASGLAVCRASGDLNTLGYTAHARSEVIIMLGRYAEAKHYIDEAIQAFERSGNVLGLGYALLKQGLLDVALGAYEHAILFFEQAEAKFFATRTEGNIIWAQIELGMACRLSGDYGRAEELYRHCLDASAAANDLWHVAQCLLGLGCLAYDQGQLGHAEAYQREALALHQQLALEVRVAEGLRHLGHVLVAAGEHRFAAAKQAFHQCLVLTVKHQLAPIALDVCVGAARLHEHEGKTQAAAQLLTLAADHEAATFETKQKARLQLRAVMSQLQLAQAQVVPPQGLTPALWATVDALIAYLVAVEPSIPAAGSAVAQ